MSGLNQCAHKIPQCIAEYLCICNLFPVQHTGHATGHYGYLVAAWVYDLDASPFGINRKHTAYYLL